MSSSREPDFKQLFEQNMGKLQQINTVIQQKITEKAAFSKDVLSQLQRINDSIKVLAGKFNDLNKYLAELQQEIQNKNTGIVDVGDKCVGLQDEIRRLQAEIARLQAEMAKSQDVQRSFKDTYDASQRDLVDKNKQMEQLIAELKQQLASSKAELNAYTQQRQMMIDENTELKRQHDGLSRKIDEITQQINNLIATTDTVNPQEIQELLQEIRTVIDNINGAVPGRSFSGNNSSSSSSSSSSGNSSKIDPNTQINIDGRNYPLGYIIDQLNKKNNENRRNTGNANNKYKTTLDNINLTGDATTIPRILQSNNIGFTSSGIIRGGKRSKKTKKTKKRRKIIKQKGGYEYSGKSKRRRFSVTRSTSSQSRSSQPRSSYETQTMTPSTYRARGTKKSKM
jgi:predicted  nucleic acid-binding Zn-ribbon protein